MELHILLLCISFFMFPLVFATTFSLISNTIFSIDVVDPEFKAAQEFKDVVWTIMEGAGKPNISDYFPMIKRFDLQGLKRHIRLAFRRLHGMIDGVVEKRLEDRNLGLSRNDDFLDMLLDLCEENGSDMDIQTIQPLIAEFFTAGTGVSSVIIEWAMAELLRNPHVLQEARNEIMQKIGDQRPVVESDIHQLSYLQAVVKETMRLHPPVPLLLPYKSRNDVDLFGFTIPKDTQVLVNSWAISRDPNVWENPLKFCPERFLGSNTDYRGRDFKFLPFGAGRRICPDMALATRMVHLILASIIQPFNWKLPDGTTPENLDMKEQFGLTLKKTVPLHAVPFIQNKSWIIDI